VDIALNKASASACIAGMPRMGTVNVALIVQAVNNSLMGCGVP